METVASFISATHSLSYLARVELKDEIVLALLQHSKHSLETVLFDERSMWPTRGDYSQHSLHSFEQLANIELPHNHLIDVTTYKPSQVEYTKDRGIDLEKTVFGTTNRISLLTYLPP